MSVNHRRRNERPDNYSRCNNPGVKDVLETCRELPVNGTQKQLNRFSFRVPALERRQESFARVSSRIARVLCTTRIHKTRGADKTTLYNGLKRASGGTWLYDLKLPRTVNTHECVCVCVCIIHVHTHAYRVFVTNIILWDARILYGYNNTRTYIYI